MPALEASRHRSLLLLPSWEGLSGGQRSDAEGAFAWRFQHKASLARSTQPLLQELLPLIKAHPHFWKQLYAVNFPMVQQPGPSTYHYNTRHGLLNEWLMNDQLLKGPQHAVPAFAAHIASLEATAAGSCGQPHAGIPRGSVPELFLGQGSIKIDEEKQKILTTMGGSCESLGALGSLAD